MMADASTSVNVSGIIDFVLQSLPMLVSEAATCGTAVEPIDDASAERLARSFKALGDPTRVKLISIIAGAEGGEACVCDLTDPVGLSQPTVSHHMKVLVEARLVTREQRGRWAFYRVVPAALSAIADTLPRI